MKDRGEKVIPLEFKSLQRSVEIHLHPLIALMNDFLDGETNSYFLLKKFINNPSKPIPPLVLKKFKHHLHFLIARIDTHGITLRETQLLELVFSSNIGGKTGITANPEFAKSFTKKHESKENELKLKNKKLQKTREIDLRHAMFKLGEKCAEKDDHANAFIHYWKSARHGHIPAIFKIAQAYRYGIGIEQNIEHASALYLILSQNPHPRIITLVMHELSQLIHVKSSWQLEYNVALAYNDKAKIAELEEKRRQDHEQAIKREREELEKEREQIAKERQQLELERKAHERERALSFDSEAVVVTASLIGTTSQSDEDKDGDKEKKATENTSKDAEDDLSPPALTYRRLSVTFNLSKATENPVLHTVSSTGSINSQESKEQKDHRRTVSATYAGGEQHTLIPKPKPIIRLKTDPDHRRFAMGAGFSRWA